MTIMLDDYSRQILNEDQAVEMLYANPQLDISNLCLQEVSKYNDACNKLHYNTMIKQLGELDIDIQQFHKQNQDDWNMPDRYKNLDIAKYLLDLCKTDVELQRVGKELLLYQQRDMFKLLCFLVYLVDTMRDNDVVWGVGRGSSVASYVLYLIGVHKIDSIYYDLDIDEFLR
tara:strand:+ start:659 stop:1174 length:516 start_codon:yes stop_codon:yes gene_type:complete